MITLLTTACDNEKISKMSSEGYVVMEDGVRLYYKSFGEGPNVLIIPMAAYLEDVLQPLADDRRVIFYDPRNRGKSDAGELDNVSLDQQIEDLEMLRKQLEIPQMALLGWSAFGMETALYTIRYPQRVTRLVQVATIAPADAIMEELEDDRNEAIDQDALDELDRKAQEGEFAQNPQEYCRRYNNLILPGSFANAKLIDQVPDACENPNEWPQNLLPYFGVLFASYGEYDLRPQLDSLKIPQLVIHGKEDGVPLAGARFWLTDKPNARLLVLSPAGHFPFIEQPEQFFMAVKTFLNGQWPKSALTDSVL
jgi:proline iminopeptidase